MWTKFNGVEGQIFPPKMASYVAVKLYGPGHVVAYNYIADFHDGINVETYGNPDGVVASAARASSTARSIRRASTGTAGRWRSTSTTTTSPTRTTTRSRPTAACTTSACMRNMLINHASHAFCNQPTLGGPVYWIRNIAYNLPGGSTRLTNGSAGVLFYNNTILSETQAAAASNMHWRNNLMLGQNAAPAILSVTTFTNYTSSDYNGFRPNPGAKAAFQWSAPPPGVRADFTGPGHTAALQSTQLRDAGRVQRGDRPGQHSVPVDYDIFVNVRRLDAQDAADRAEDLQGRRVRLPAEAERGAGRSRCRAAERHRRVRGPRARHRCARSGHGHATLRPAAIVVD